MRNFIATLFVAAFAVSSITFSPAFAKGSKKAEDKDIKGTLSITKTGQNITAIELTGSDKDKTVYEIKNDTKTQGLVKDFDGKTVKVKGKISTVAGKKTITLEKIEAADAAKPKAKK